MQQQELEPSNENNVVLDSETDDSRDHNNYGAAGGTAKRGVALPETNEKTGENGEPELPEEIRRELNEDLETRAECIESIRSWIVDNDEFYGRTDDSFILRFLRVCKFDLDKTKQRIQRHYRARHKYSQYYQRTEEAERMLEEAIKSRFAYKMDFAGNCKHNLVIGYIGSYSEKYGLDLYMNTATAQFVELATEEPSTQVNGIHIIVDYSGLNMTIFRQMTPATLWRCVNLAQMSVAIRIKGIHIINAPTYAMKIVYILKLFLSKKLGKRIHMHKDLESLHQHISPEYLPAEFGGTAGPEQNFVDSSMQWFRNGKYINTKNELYGINKFPQQSDDCVSNE